MMIDDLPLLLLDAVLFPEGALDLRLFEPRYLDMAKDALRDGTPFGICLIAQGHEVGAPATPQPFGTLAHISDWDMVDLGILEVRVTGSKRFRLLSHRVGSNGLVSGRAEPIEAPAVQPIPSEYARLVPLLRAIIDDMGEKAPPKPHRFFDAFWLGCRWSEVLPIPALARLKLLELDDALVRLEVVQRFLEDKGVLR